MIQNTTIRTNVNDNERKTKVVEKDDDEEFVTASIEIEEEASDDLTSSDDCRIANSGEFEVSLKTRASHRIGDRFQAVIPTELVEDCDDLCGELVSAPSDYDTKVESETTKLSVLDSSSSQRLGKDKKSIMESWSNSDIEDFEKGMLSYPKQFDKIKRFEMKRSKKLVKDLVEFYYVWKTLERYQDWEDERARREMERRKAKKRLEVQDFDEFYGEKKRKLSEMLLEEEEEEFHAEPKKRRVLQEEQPHAFDYFDEEHYDSIPFLPPPEQPEPPSSLWDEPEKPIDSFQNQIENYSTYHNDDRSFVSHHTSDFLDFASIEATDQFNQKLDVLAYFPPLPENDVFSFMDPLE